jgi:subfamily B ATP-binding cassette protein MsbA
MKGLRRAFRYLKPYWFLEIVALLCAASGTLCGLAFPWILKILIDDVFVHRSMKALNFCVLAFAAAEVLSAVLGVARQALFTYVGERAVADLRNELFAHLQELSMADKHREKVGRTLSAFTNDIGAMQSLYASTLVDLITNTLQMVITLAVLFRIQASLAAVSWPILPLFAVSILAFGKPLRISGDAVQSTLSTITEELQESISGLREVKAFTREESQIKRFRALFASLVPVRLKQSVIGAVSGGVNSFASWGGVIFVMWWGGRQVIAEGITPGVLVAFVNYLAGLFGPTAWFVQLNVQLQSAMAGADRVFDVLDTRPGVSDRPDSIELPPLRGEVEIDHVSFTYEAGKAALQDVSLDVQAGERIAFVGPSGSGKTTLTGLLCRFFDPTSGAIRIDGHDLRDVTQASLRHQIGVVFQETFLFGASVRENIRFGREDATDAEIEAAAKAANAHRFILDLPEGYDTPVGERGAKLSGGQRQRIAIARALLRDPRILILDEATASLDTESEAAVQEALERLMEGRTSFVVAHRLSTVAGADRIVVLEAGRIVEIGSHAELIAGSGIYRRLYEVQFASPKENGREGEFAIMESMER